MFTTFAVLALGVARPPTAQAHTAANSPASNYVSRITAVRPPSDNFTASVIEAGSRLQLRWRFGPDIVVLDYDGNPYLRIGSRGVEENLESNAVYLNRNRSGSSTLPDGLHPDGPPRWQRVSTTPTARWHDHRIHWMLATLPPTVKGRTGTTHLVQRWDVSIFQDTTKHTIRGDLRWVPGPSPLPFLLLAVALGAGIVAFALLRRRGATPVREPVRHTWMGIALIALVIVDALHLFGIAFGIHGSIGSAMGRVLSVGFVSIIIWVVGAVAIVLLWQGRTDSLYLVTLCAAVITFVGGLSDLAVLSRTSVPFAFGVGVARVCVAATLGLGVGLAAAGVLLTRPDRGPGSAPPAAPI